MTGARVCSCVDDEVHGIEACSVADVELVMDYHPSSLTKAVECANVVVVHTLGLEVLSFALATS